MKLKNKINALLKVLMDRRAKLLNENTDFYQAIVLTVKINTLNDVIGLIESEEV